MSGPTSVLPTSNPAFTSGCNDSAIQSTYSFANVHSVARAYGSLYEVTNLRGKLEFYTASNYTAPGAVVIHVHAFANNPTGFDIFNTGCFRMHVSGPLLLEPKVALPSQLNANGYSGYTEWRVPYNTAYSGMDVTTQAIWNDSVTAQAKLTSAVTVTIPQIPPTSFAVRNTVFDYAIDDAAAFGPYQIPYYNPALCYKK